MEKPPCNELDGQGHVVDIAFFVQRFDKNPFARQFMHLSQVLQRL